jgi:hypothetical protein
MNRIGRQAGRQAGKHHCQQTSQAPCAGQQAPGRQLQAQHSIHYADKWQAGKQAGITAVVCCTDIVLCARLQHQPPPPPDQAGRQAPYTISSCTMRKSAGTWSPIEAAEQANRHAAGHNGFSVLHGLCKSAGTNHESHVPCNALRIHVSLPTSHVCHVTIQPMHHLALPVIP